MADQPSAKLPQVVMDIAMQVTELIASQDHAATLDALNLVYKTLAKRFACCTQTAAHQSFQTSMQLAEHAALQRQGLVPVDGEQPIHLH
jgi:hypothetical protein